MTWIYVVVGSALLIAEVALVYELHQARKEMQAIRSDVPKWVGVSMAISILTTAIKERSRNA